MNMVNFDYDFLNPDKRPAKNGWCTGMYAGTCRNCGDGFTGAKGAWTCSGCAYDFSEQLECEQLWHGLGWVYTAQYIARKILKNK